MKLSPEIQAKLDAMSPEDRKLHEEAIRRANVIVSDLKLYYAHLITEAFTPPEGSDKVDNRKIKAILGPKIKDSWQLYKQQVDPKVIEATKEEYLKEALNNILAGGEKIF